LESNPEYSEAMIDWKNRAQTADDVVARIKSGDRVFVHGASATPAPLLDALCRRTDLEDVTLYHLHTTGSSAFADARQQGRFRSVSLFAGPALRGPIAEGRADFITVFLSEIPALFLSRKIPLDAALVQLSPPNRHGHATLGTSVDASMAAAVSAPLVLAEINERMPRTLGHSVLPLRRLTAF